VLAIITIITIIVITSQSDFNKTLILQNTAYDVALTLRSAETFGLGSRASGTTVNAGYGLHFSSGTNDSFILFADASGGASCAGQPPSCKPGDYIYTSGSDILVQTYTLGNGITVSDFCAYPSVGVGSCKYAHGGGLSYLNIVFERPNPISHISANGSLYTGGACITLTSPQGGFRYISVAASGQINGSAPSCP